MSERERQTAVHEAGHAVAMIRLQLDTAMTSVVPDEERQSLGHVLGAGPDNVWTAEEAPAHVLACLAGYGALVAAGYPEEMACNGADDDFEQARELIEFWRLDGDLDAWREKASSMMREPQNVAAVALVAEYLQRHRRLSIEHLDILVELADGRITEQEWQRFLSRFPIDRMLGPLP